MMLGLDMLVKCHFKLVIELPCFFIKLYLLILTLLSSCRDLLYKPIVLCKTMLFSSNALNVLAVWWVFSIFSSIFAACGHMCCFWCVHKSMSGVRESKCPTCRHQYYHFPTVCQLLHFLLLKLYPVAYNRRTNQTLGMSISLTIYMYDFRSLAQICILTSNLSKKYVI